MQMTSVQNLEMSKGRIVAPRTVDKMCMKYIPVILTKNSTQKLNFAAYIVTNINVLSPISDKKIKINDYVKPGKKSFVTPFVSDLSLVLSSASAMPIMKKATTEKI